MRKRIIVLGSTGSIGRNALDVLSRLRDEWQVVGLAAGSQGAALAQQANEWRPEVIAVADGESAPECQSSLNYKPRLLGGGDALFDLIDSTDCDCVVCGVVGVAGLRATMRAAELGRRIALANKEALVIAGSLLMPLARRSEALIVPIDSEHSAIFQALRSGNRSEVRKIYLTASGGPFRTRTLEEMDDITMHEALIHPTWKMGPKVTIDSATMMNKALEIVEAAWLFEVRPDQIEVIVHPESIIHSLVEYCDGSMIAQLGVPDMRTPIQYALTHPKRGPSPAPRLNLSELGQLTLHAPDPERFPALKLGYEAARRGGTSGAVLNAANEAAVALFRDGAMAFRDIARVTQRVLAEHEFHAAPSFEELIAADQWARQEVNRCLIS